MNIHVSHVFLNMASIMLIITLIMNLYCFFKRVAMEDKILCLDLMTMQLMNGIALIFFYSKHLVYLDVMLLLASIIFLTTTGLAFYLMYHR